MSKHAISEEAFLRAMSAIVGVMIAAAVAFLIFITVNSSSCKRQQAVWESEYSYGVERTVVLYGFDGETVAEWHGRMDVEHRSDGLYDLVFFDADSNIEKRILVDAGMGQLVIESEAE